MKSNKNKVLIFANIVLTGTAILFMLLIYYLLYRSYSFSIQLNFKLLVIFIAGLLFSIVTLFLRENWKINIALAIFSTIVAAYCAEIILLFKSNAKTFNMKIDKRSKLEVLEDMRAEGIDAWPLVRPFHLVESNGLLTKNHRLFPLGGISKKMSIVCNEGGQYLIFKSDEHGFNNPGGLHQKDVIKAVLVGDSFTLGHCVQPGEDIASQLRNMGINALNLGNGGGPLIELATLKEYAEDIQPEIVLWIYFEGNDLHDLKREQKASMLMQYLEDDYSQNLLERQEEIDMGLINFVNSRLNKVIGLNNKREAETVVQKLLELKHNVKINILKLRRLRKSLGLRNFDDQSQQPQYKSKTNNELPLKLFSEILAATSRRSSDWGGKLYFVYLPGLQRYTSDYYDESSWNREDVLAIVHELGIPLIDFHEILEKHPEPSSLVPFLYGHYNAAGYKLISELIFSSLMEDGLIYPRSN